MEIDPDRYYAVISGDFIGFSRLSVNTRRGMYGFVKTAGNALTHAFPGIMPWDVDMFRGDGWQMALSDPVYALRAALFFSACLRFQTRCIPIALRMAIAVGQIDYIPENKVSAGDGSAFRMSGKLLDKISRIKTPALRFIMEHHRAAKQLNRIVLQAGRMSGSWTCPQAKAMMTALRHIPDHSGGLSALKYPSNSGTRNLQSAGWEKILSLIARFEETLCAAVGELKTHSLLSS